MSKPAPPQAPGDSNPQSGQTLLRELHGGKVNALTDAYLGTDIGTGSGAWAIAMARQFPDADVVGLDLVPVNSSSSPQRAASQLPLRNLRRKWRVGPLPIGCIQHRSHPNDASGVKNYHELFRQVHRILRPGGVLLVQEAPFAAFDANKDRVRAEKPEDPGFTWFNRLISTATEATKSRNPSFADIERVHEILSGMSGDLWESVSGSYFFLPVGPWATDRTIERRAGELMRTSAIRIATTARPTLISFGIAPEEVDYWAEQVEAELMGGRVQQYVK
ncbi:hypothetical protein FRC00_005934, partial [Tulasnella sp. 408]